MILLNSKRGLIYLGKHVLACLVAFLFVANVYANPVLDHVASGNVSISQTSSSTTIQQQSQKAIINWQSFNIGKQETTHFQQPAGGVALNRIDATQGPSSVYGTLTATGQIILINPAGIFFGPTAYVNVSGLIATTANLSDQDFLNGYYHFTSVPNFNGVVSNQGQLIAADHGLIALLSDHVSNDGYIQANLGHIILATGSVYTLSFAGNDLINFSVDAKNAAGKINNTGSLIANGGTVLVTANTAAGILDTVINMEGVAQAQSVQQQKGQIILSANNDTGVVRVAGKLDASGKTTGGDIAITGHNILVDHSAYLDVSGDTGGGSIAIGGNYHGEGPLPNANAVVMLSGAVLKADALINGDGGKIVLWSDNYTNAAGLITARGIGDGKGGFVETSSHGLLTVNDITVNTSAAKSNLTGTWLLDPSDLTIDTTADSNVTASSPFEPATQSTNSILNITTLTNALASNNVDITTTSGIGPGAGDIIVNTDIDWSSGFGLTFNAFHNIVLNASITNSDNATITFNSPVVINTSATISGGILDAEKSITLATGTTDIINTSVDGSGIFGNIDGAANLIIAGTGSLTISNPIGSTTSLESLDVTNPNVVINNSVSTTSGQTYNNPIALNQAQTYSSNGNIIFNNTIDGGYPLTVISGGSVTFDAQLGGVVPLSSVNITGTLITINSDGVNTTGNQTYNGQLNITAPSSFIVSGANPIITINNGITGNFTLNLSANTGVSATFLMTGAVSAPLVISGNSNTTNSLSFDSGYAQNWNISGTNAGTITGAGSNNITFIDIQNLTGANSAGNNFIFANNASVSGSINGGPSQTSSLNYAAYTTPLKVTLSSIARGSRVSNGSVLNSVNAPITTFSNINTITGSSTALNSTLILPNHKNTLRVTGPLRGLINDPVSFSNFQTIVSNNGSDTLFFNQNPSSFRSSNGFFSATFSDGSTMYFENFAPPASNSQVSQVMQQSNSNNSNSSTYNSDVALNTDQSLQNFYIQTNQDFSQVKITPDCGTAQ